MTGGILFLEDDRAQMTIYRQMTKKYLQDRPVFYAETVPEAEEILQAQEIHLAVVDLMIPTENGADLIMKMKENSAYDCIKIVVVTAAEEGTLLHNALGGVVDDYVTKPIDQKAFSQMINEIL